MCQKHPDYQMFLDVARKSGAKLVIFAAREFETAELDELVDQMEDCDLSREEQREYESRLRELRVFEGVTCTLELAFDYNSRLYVYEVQPDWYEEFLNVEEEISSRFADENGADAGDSWAAIFPRTEPGRRCRPQPAGSFRISIRSDVDALSRQPAHWRPRRQDAAPSRVSASPPARAAF